MIIDVLGAEKHSSFALCRRVQGWVSQRSSAFRIEPCFWMSLEVSAIRAWRA